MTLQAGLMQLIFLSEHRTLFANSSSEIPSKVLGEFAAYDIRLSEKFREPSEAQITFHASREWFNRNLIPSSKPGSTDRKYTRACYVSFTGPSSSKVVMKITSARIDLTQKAYEGNFANITITAQDPRIWLTSMLSDLTNPPTTFNGPIRDLIVALSNKCSNNNYSGKLPFQRLPISPLDLGFTPNSLQQSAGIVATSELPNSNVSFPLSDPKPVYDDLQEALLQAGRDFELYPLLTHGADGTNSPWWKWVIRKRQSLPETLSEQVGAIMVRNFDSDLLINEVAYWDDSSRTFSLGNFNEPTLGSHKGPWFGARLDSDFAPKGVEIKKWLRRRANASTKALKAVNITVDVNSSTLSTQRLNPGTYVSFDFSGTIFKLAVDELTWSYDYKVGDWTLDDWSL